MLTTYVETRLVPVSMLAPFPGNANVGNVAQLRGSLQANGQYRALITRMVGADEKLVVVAGWHTLQALIAEGATEVRCEIHVGDDKWALRTNIADNKFPEYSHRDVDLLLDQLDLLEGEYAGTGFTEDQVNAMLTPAPEGPKDGEGPGGNEPTVGFNLIFDNEVQQDAWYSYLRWLRKQHPDLETNGERIHADLGSRGIG